MARKIDDDELIEHWALVGDELGRVAGKRGPTRLGFSLLLKFYARHGRFPRGRGELPDEAVAYVARQVAVSALDLAFYEWDGRTVASRSTNPRDSTPPHKQYRTTSTRTPTRPPASTPRTTALSGCSAYGVAGLSSWCCCMGASPGAGRLG